MGTVPLLVARRDAACMHAEDGTPMHNLDERKMELSRNFQIYAFEGASGEPRWRNAESDFRKDLDELEQVRPPRDASARPRPVGMRVCCGCCEG